MRTFPALQSALAVGLTMLFTAAGIAQDEKPLDQREVKRALELAEERMKEGKPAEAGGFYLRVLQDYPERGDVRLKLARIYKDFDEWENAASAYALAVEHLEDAAEQAECYEGMVMAYAKTANYSKVVEVGPKAVETNPQSADVHVSVALGLAKTGALSEAAAMARKALELAPTSAVAYSTLGEAALAEGKVDEAESAFRKALELDSSNAESQAGLADILYRKGDYQGAVDAATKAIELNSQLTRARAVRGLANNALGKPDEAYSDLAMAITVNANDPDANLAFAQVYKAQGNLTMASTYFQKVIELNPNSTDAYLALAEIYVSQGKLQEAGTLMSQALEKMPDNAKAHLFMGLAHEASSANDQALASFSKAVELDDTLAAAHYRKGRQQRMQGQRVEQKVVALPELEKAVSLEGENPDYLTELGVGYYEAQQLDNAYNTLQKAVSLPEYQNALGWAYYGVTLKDKQQFADAAQYFQKAVEAYPNYGLAHWGLAWSSFGQIKAGCPCTPEDEALVQTLVEHAKLAAQYGVNDPALTERSDILARGEKVK
ncbi:MAG TPA: tetratricopeptide repeat protein [Vicinamibacteria bacterium]|nr:tetratricopeptide repeat protein [Vicinamibacteria bacterium]